MIYSTRAVNVGGTAGAVTLAEGQSFTTGAPGEPGGGLNPEQFVAMAWSTCLNATLIAVLNRAGISARSRVSVDVELRRGHDGQFFFTPHAHVSIEDLDDDRVRAFAEQAHQRCPVSKLIRSADCASVDVEPF